MSKWIDAEWIRNVYADFENYDNRNEPIAITTTTLMQMFAEGVRARMSRQKERTSR